MLRRIRWIRLGLYLAGVSLVTGSLLGAHALSGRDAHSAPPDDKAPAENKIVGPLVLGTVDSSPQRIAYGLAPVLQSGTIAKKRVKDGDEVHAGDVLYVFDSSTLQSVLEVAKSNVQVARTKVAAAKDGVLIHATSVELLKKAVKIAEWNVEVKNEAYNLYKRSIEDYFRNEKIPQDQWKARFDKDDKLFTHYAEFIEAKGKLEIKQGELAKLEREATTVNNLVQQAEDAVKLAEKEMAKAQTAIDLCTVKAKIDGTIEQVTISEGSTLGMGTMKPALWLIPAGPRIVRAEIESDFAHKITNKLIGKEVTIYDNTDPKLTYRGRVKRIGNTFLPKRTANEGLIASDTLVLEAEVEVIDAAPADRPPLRVGQRVRVDLGQ